MPDPSNASLSEILSLRPFVPARDYMNSIAFYQKLGFALGYSDDTVAMLSLGPAAFILQNFYVEALAANFMLQLLVPDADTWWAARDLPALAGRFGAKPPIAPTMQHWGLKVGYVFDPSGVLWHIAEPPQRAVT